ncbi:hypothetical protein CAEBREN_06063 [Caenorhabditis brenneri]|uniref:Methyltransferase FkbM domain-containing protein n=1 Tax=Caenorhabditis brenneri TaxID=135651 RepID=G0MRM7_CAEBE|nr:hypothetical protein CAEBREN_06063 [Caenorhabditis brenneri]
MGSTILIGVLLLFAVCSHASITPCRLPSFELNPTSPTNAKQFPRLDNVTDDMTVDDAERMNRDWSVNDAKYMVASTCQYEGERIPYGWCRHKGLKASGKYKLAFIGNSYVSNHATMLYQECADKANSMLQGSAYGCEPLYPSDKDPECIANFTDFEVHIRDEKPDYAFILTRYISIGDPFPAGVTTFDEDPIYQTMKEQMLKFISNIKYKLYIMDAFPRVNQPMVHQIGRLMKEKEDPVKIDKEQRHPTKDKYTKMNGKLFAGKIPDQLQISEMMKKSGKKSVELLKIDIEGGEFTGLEPFIKEYPVCQIFVEIHGTPAKHLEMLQTIAKYKFRIFNVDLNPFCRHCCEYSFINEKCMEQFDVTPLDIMIP